MGLLGLAGLPLTAGFPWRWTLLAQPPEAVGVGVLLMVLSMLAILWVVLRWTRVLFQAEQTEVEVKQRTSGMVAVVVMAGMWLLLGVFPQIAIPWVAQATSGLANLSP
jgi:NADH:ubiquinone oxidoreductase subunit 2 (subunit N)